MMNSVVCQTLKNHLVHPSQSIPLKFHLHLSKRELQMNNRVLKPRRISFYIRVSTEEQASNPEGSIKNQEERLRMAVKLKNMEGHFGDIVATYIDRAKSGKDTNRPELQKLLMSIRKHETDLVLVSELSRISRSIKDFSDIWQMMKDNGCGFQSLRENFDTTTAAGEMVLFTVANIAQFERRQISERVSANFNVRAQRGLFNGGSIPFGYRRIEEKRGYLEVDEEWAPSVRAAFRAVISEGTLASAAKWLNEQGFRLKSTREGGGLRTRMGFYTVRNLGEIIRSKFYIGIKSFHQNGERKEVEAVWLPIIDRETYEKANEILNKNHRRHKEGMTDRYPYQLSGLVFCKKCGDRMVGKSAHGRTHKIGYYEHASNTVPGAKVPELERSCDPVRVQAKLLEPALWNEIINLISEEQFAKELLISARRAHQLNPGSKDAEKYNHVVFNVDRQLEVMAERLATLPQSISPTPIYKQMEKLEERKKEAQSKITELQSSGFIKDEPSELQDFQRFLKAIGGLLQSDDNPKIRLKIVRFLVHKVNVIPDGFEAHFKVGESYVKIFLIKFENGERQKKKAQTLLTTMDDNLDKKNALPDLNSGNASQFLGHFGSNTCQIGAPGRT